MRALLQITAVAAAAFILGGCKESPAPPSPQGQAQQKQQASAISLDTIAKEAQGFSVGPSMSARVVYVFFDPQCPHCAALWEAAQPLKTQARFVWIPVGLLNANSALQGAVLLGAPDPVAAMDTHEKSLRGGTGGIATASATEDKKAVVARNTELFNRFGLGGVPAVIGKHAQTGELVQREGSMPTQALAAVLGLQAP